MSKLRKLAEAIKNEIASHEECALDRDSMSTYHGNRAAILRAALAPVKKVKV